MVSWFISFYELAFFLWQKLYSVAEKNFSIKKIFISDGSGFLRQKIRRKFFSVKETCFCDITFFVKEIGFSLCVTINCFCDKKILFWDFIHDFQGKVSVRNGSFNISDNIYNNFVEPWCLPPPVFHTVLEKVLLPPTCHMSNVTCHTSTHFILHIFLVQSCESNQGRACY